MRLEHLEAVLLNGVEVGLRADSGPEEVLTRPASSQRVGEIRRVH